MYKRILTLSVALLMLFLASCSGDKSGDAPDGMVMAENGAADFYFYYPEDWELDRNDGMISIQFSTQKLTGSDTYSTISVTAAGLSDTRKGANDYWEEYRQGLEKLYESMTITKDYVADEVEFKVDGVLAARKEYTAVFDGDTYKFIQIVCVRTGSAYVLTFTATEADYDDTVSAFDSVIANFHFK